MANSDKALRKLVEAIVEGDSDAVSRLLEASPELARARFQEGATRQAEKPFFLDRIRRYIWRDDTALHIAAAGYQAETVRRLISERADIRARNRHGDEPLHAAAVGAPGSPNWNPARQKETLVALIEAGADPNCVNKSGVTPLHRAVRTRCAAAVRVLLERGADPERGNKNGSTPMVLARMNTGRGGSGSPEAKAQQQEIIQLLEERVYGRRPAQ